MLILTLIAGIILLCAIAAFFACKLAISYKRFSVKNTYSDSGMIDDLPSVSVCIPARNETHAMTQCLERVIASKYPKIEIIVLDDSSVDDTSILIKSFAHAGVRFVEGSPLPDGWLGKNHALQGLLKEASGRYILYMDVDTHIAPDTIGLLVAYARAEDAAMVSVLPRRNDGWRLSVIWATLRYYWELIFHTKTRPAVASNAWMIHRNTLRQDIGGFEDFKMSVQPETMISALLSARGKYRFLIGTMQLGVSYEKRWPSQVETAVRLLLPRVGGRTMNGFFTVAGLVLLNMPTVFIVIAALNDWWLLASAAFVTGLVFGALYASFAYQTWNRGWWLGGILWPLLVFQEMLLMFASIVRYSTGRVTWKGRPVTKPGRAIPVRTLEPR